MKGIKEAFIDAGEISQMLGIGMTKAYAIIRCIIVYITREVIAEYKHKDYSKLLL